MQDLFYIEIDDKIANYDSKTASLKIRVKTSSFKEFHKEYSNFLKATYPKLTLYENRVRELSKALKSNIVSNNIKREVSLLKIILEDLKNGFKKNCSEMYNDFIGYYQDIDELFNTILNSKKVKEDFTELNFEMLEWYHSRIRRKLEVCERLKTIEDVPWKVLVFFKEDSFETHFTKYHLNLESYSDILHGLIRVELEEKLIKPYNELEDEHFKLVENIKNGTSFKEFLKYSSEIMSNYEKMFIFPSKFLRVQYRGEIVEKDINQMIDTHSMLTSKMKSIVLNIKKVRDNDVSLILKAMNLFYEFPLENIEKFKPEDVTSDKILSFIETKEIRIEDEILLPVLEIIEPRIANSIKLKIASILKLKGKYQKYNKSAQYFMKKNEFSIFENRYYYSHEMVSFNFLPEKHEDVAKNNHYLNTAGYEKTFREKRVMRISSEVFSKVYDKKVKYTVFIELNHYMINPSISQRYA